MRMLCPRGLWLTSARGEAFSYDWYIRVGKLRSRGGTAGLDWWHPRESKGSTGWIEP